MDKQEFDAKVEYLVENVLREGIDPVQMLAEECVVALYAIDLLSDLLSVVTGVSADIIGDEAITVAYGRRDDYRE